MTSGKEAAAPGELWIDAQLPPALAAWLTEWGAVLARLRAVQSVPSAWGARLVSQAPCSRVLRLEA